MRTTSHHIVINICRSLVCCCSICGSSSLILLKTMSNVFNYCFCSQLVVSYSRVQIMSIHQNVIWVKTLSERTQRIVAIPKVRFKFRLHYGQSFSLMRTQFPLRLAYAMTMNKSQSQTLRRTLVDCRQPPFSHDHLYVASSRVRSANDIRYYFDCNNELINEHTCSIVQNVVYRSLLI